MHVLKGLLTVNNTSEIQTAILVLGRCAFIRYHNIKCWYSLKLYAAKSNTPVGIVEF